MKVSKNPKKVYNNNLMKLNNLKNLNLKTNLQKDMNKRKTSISNKVRNLMMIMVQLYGKAKGKTNLVHKVGKEILH